MIKLNVLNYYVWISFNIPKINLRNVTLFNLPLGNTQLILNPPINRIISINNIYNIHAFINLVLIILI